ncbi:MAG: DNA translocase FtsK 4TM domain-containing protein [Polymorphobacter sp.]|uniref:FtsK/SpoIIIE family DNA translocase n=1 Tax=Polymorphobacter sp. TaxID=1909290 RepID=UPI003A86EB4F
MASRASTAPDRRGVRGRAPAPQPGFVARARVWLAEALRTTGRWLAGLLLIALAVGLAVALFSYSPDDPSFNTVTGRAATNPLGSPGSHVADLLLQGFGWPALALALLPLAAGVRLLRAEVYAPLRALTGIGLAVLLLAMGLGALASGSTWLIGTPMAGPQAGGAGGMVGTLAGWASDALAELGWLAGVPVGVILGLALAAIGLALMVWGLGLRETDFLWLDRLMARRAADAPEDEDAPLVLERTEGEDVRILEDAEVSTPRVVTAPKAAAPPPRARQQGLNLGDMGVLPGLDLLSPPPAAPAQRVDEAALAANARLLEGVLEDFGVKGRIGEVRPGPVVTMYELEPAPGIKASRVIGLADDIARNMSALSARVAVVPGRNVIGIELPNGTREMVSLSELLASEAFEARSLTLPLVLGKDIAGEPVVVDLAPMPHLLIAGTTGSGKSVGLNAMILSLLYRMTPAQCRLIMIDPKMLELKTYDGIPHLLAPVVTEPTKAVRALKWAVEEMEDRYRKMSEINVRGLATFNQKVREAKASGRPFVRRVQTGWDPDTEAPIIEEEVLDFEPMPLVVVVVDELADLMMTAGKEVEFLIQRLAQKARAAGIHLIMATQRPSVDVITGVIKANLPTRISFQVTSKIDSRTILGEQGAEQLLGKGDMLFMAGGKMPQRIHGPFVSDDEVEAVADHWRRQGMPAYLDAVTEEPGEGWEDNASLPLAGGSTARSPAASKADEMGDEEDIYARAVQAVAVAQKASTSYLQRQLRIGYNNAARLIERMEEDGFVSRPDHVNRREVLIDEHGNRR